MRDLGAAAAGFSLAGDGSRWTCSGPVTFANAAQVYAAASRLPLPRDGVIEFDRLGAVDSSAVAVLLGLKRRAMNEQKSLRFANLPPPLSTLASVYGVDGLLDDDAGR